MILDVGCGTRPTGDVNVDLTVGETAHRELGPIKKPKAIRNLIIADCHHLPIRTNAVEKTNALHLLEHVDDPITTIKEMIRVSTNEVFIEVPHAWERYGFQMRPPVGKHNNYFRSRWFHQCLKNFPIKVEVVLGSPSKFFSIFTLPKLIRVTIHLNKG